MWKHYALFILLVFYPHFGKTFSCFPIAYVKICLIFHPRERFSLFILFPRHISRSRQVSKSYAGGHNDFDNSIRSHWHLCSNSASFRGLSVPDGGDICGFVSRVLGCVLLSGTFCEVVACHSSCVRWRRLFRAVLDFSFKPRSARFIPAMFANLSRS